MKFSKSFIDKYADNEEMQSIIKNTDEHLIGAKISDLDKETIYEFVYGHNKAIIEPNSMNINKLYEKLDYLGSIEHGDVIINGLSYWGGYYNEGSGNPDRPALIVLKDNVISNEEDFLTKKESEIHELEHLAGDNFRNSSRGIMVISRTNSEIMTQNSTIDTMKALGYELPIREIPLKTVNGIDNAFILSNSCSFVYVEGMADLIRGLYGERQSYLSQFEGETLPVIGDKGFLSKFGMPENLGYAEIEVVTSELDSNKDFHSYIKAQSKILELYKEGLDGSDVSISGYINAIQNFKDKAMIFVIDGQEYNSSYVQTATLDIENIYSKIHNLTSAQTEQEVNPLTRSKDCKDFLIAINGLKSTSLDFPTDDILNMKYFQSELNGQPIIAVQIGEQQLAIDGKINEKTGLVVINEVTQTNEKLIETTRNNWESSNYTNASLQLYLSPDQQLISVNNPELSTLRFSSFQKDSTYLLDKNKAPIFGINDSSGNNLMHLLVSSPTENAHELLKRCAEENPELTGKLLTTPNKDGITPLDIAIENNNVKLFKVCHDNEIVLDVNYENGQQKSPLLLSMDESVSPIITKALLIEHDANPDKLTSEGKLALSEILISDPSSNKIEMLLNAQADFDRQSIIEGSPNLYSPLEIASGMYDGELRTDALKMFIQEGADICLEGYTGESPLGYAVRTENIEFFITCAQAGMDEYDLGVENLPFTPEDIEKIQSAIDEFAASEDFEEAFALE